MLITEESHFSPLPKPKVAFAPEVSQREILREKQNKVREVLSILGEATRLFSSDREESLNKIEKAMSKISSTFEKDTYEFNKLMAKALINKAILLPPQNRADILDLANSLDPTRDKFSKFM